MNQGLARGRGEKWRLLCCLLLLLLAAACRSEDPGSRFSSNARPATFAPPGMRPTTLELADLVADPAAYAGETVQVSGNFQHLSVVVCDGRVRRSPATWALQDGEAQIGATGYDNLLRRLLPVGFVLTVSGRWQRWQGPVGCGKDAPVREIWYLLVDDIVAPMPLARITATPGGPPLPVTGEDLPGPAGESALPTATLAAPETPTLAPAYPLSTAETTPAASTATASPTAPLFASPRPTRELSASSTPDLAVTASSTLTATTGAGTPSPTTDATTGATPGGDGATATATVEGAVAETPTPTATVEENPNVTVAGRGTLASMGVVDFPDLVLALDRLGENEAHRWQFNVQAGETITVSTLGGPATDLRLVVADAGGTILAAQDSAPAGSIEVIEGLAVSAAGTLRVTVYETGQAVGHYALLLNKSTHSSDAYYTLAGLLAYNQSRTSSLLPETDQIWLFPGEAGDTISINLAPTDASDLIFHFYGPDGQPLLDQYRDDTEGGQSEFLLNFNLPDDGLYAVHVGEYNYEAASYTLTVSRQ